MNAMNQIIIEGNVVRDSTVKQTPRGTKVCTMPIASNRSYFDANGEKQSEVVYFDVQAWGDSFTEKVAKHGTKGCGIRVVGRLKQDRWKNEDGKSKEKTYIVAEHIEFKFPQNSEKKTESADAEIKNLEEAANGIMEEEKISEAAF